MYTIQTVPMGDQPGQGGGGYEKFNGGDSAPSSDP